MMKSITYLIAGLITLIMGVLTMMKNNKVKNDCSQSSSNINAIKVYSIITMVMGAIIVVMGAYCLMHDKMY
jgi:hypothetical protein